jgi:dolichol-phosphate mannosyltransferase
MSGGEALELRRRSRPARIRIALSHRDNWVQLMRFVLVGASGYVVNVAVFAAATGPAGYHHLVAATLAFLVAVTNNFWWNRVWTFGVRHVRKRLQAPRFLGVSLAGFVVAAGVLEVLVTIGGVTPIVAQAASIVVATPVNFAGAKLWSFRGDRGEGR